MEKNRNTSPQFQVIVKEVVNGNKDSFQVIYDAIAGKMYSLCLRYAGNTNDANDWFQDAFLKLISNLEAYRGEGAFEGWARKIFISTCLDQLKRRITKPLPVEVSVDVADGNYSALDKLESEDLMNAVRRLPDAARTIINLNLVEGYSHKEIGKLLNISEEGSRSQLFRARILLKKIISREYAPE